MFKDGKVWMALNDANEEICLLPGKANRHGLIAGATGTGKTVTLRVMAEAFSDMGVPVFLADVKGDLAGMMAPGIDSEDMQARIERFNLKENGFLYQGYPVTFWDIYGQNGIQLRTTISEMGPLLLSRIMKLNELQTNILSIVFKIADDNGLLLIDTKDLKAMLNHVNSNHKEYEAQYGKMSPASIAAILRAVVALEIDGGEVFFGEPGLNIYDLLTTEGGKGMINILDSESLINNGRLYSTFLLWLLSELFEMLPEVGDPEKPRMVFFFDEAHLIFKDAPRSLLDKVEQIVRLIRSKGIGIYFITQQPADIPDSVLAQLGNKMQHALRAYTPKERKGLKAAAQAFRPNPDLNAEAALGELGTGEVLVSLLDEEGVPTMVQRAYVMPPRSYLGTCSDEVRRQAIQETPLHTKYAKAIDRESAYEILQKRAQQAAAAEAEPEYEDEEPEQNSGSLRDEIRRNAPRTSTRSTSGRTTSSRSTRTAKEPPSVIEKVATSALQTFGRTIASSLARGILGSLLKK